MSVFSMIRRGHKAAKEHKNKQAEKEKQEQEKAPYKHVPRHAALDALSGGPAAYRDVDRVKIAEQNKRRSAMTASGIGMSGMMTPVHMSMPRNTSSLSYVSYPASYVSPVVQVPRAYSYTSMPPGWSHQGGEMSYAPAEPPTGVSLKGKEVDRVLISSMRGSRSSSKNSMNRVAISVDPSAKAKGGTPSPTGSSGESSSSQDDLEMRGMKSAMAVDPAPVPSKARRPTSDTADYFHRLHPSSHSRKMSDPAHGTVYHPPPVSNAPSPSYYPPQVRNAYTHYSSRPGPPSRTNSNSSIATGIPPVPVLPPMHLGSAVATPAPVSATSSASSVTSVPGEALGGGTVQQPSPTLAPSSTTIRQVANSHLPADFPLRADYVMPNPEPAPVLMPNNSYERRPRRLSKTSRYGEFDRLDSNTASNLSSTLDFGFSTPAKEPAYVIETTPMPSPRMAPPSPTYTEESVAVQPTKRSKLSKATPRSMPPSASAPKPKKTNRWSLRSSKAAAVAG